MRDNDGCFFKFLGDIKNLKKTNPTSYKELLSYLKDRKKGLQGLLNQVLQHQEELKELKNGQSRYYYSPYACSVIRQPDNGQLALIIREEDYLDSKKVSGGYKSGGNSLLIDHHGIKPFFTLASFGEKHISNLKAELEFIDKTESPFIQRPLPGTEREIKGQRRLSISAPRAKSNGKTASFNYLEDFLLAVKCLALGLKDISDANYVHQDIKPHNTLILPNGVLQVIDLGISTPKGEGEYLGSAGYTAPEILVDVITEQRENLVKICGDNRKYHALLLNQERLPLEQQINNIRQALYKSGITATRRFSYNFIVFYSFNEATILWCQRKVKADKDQKSGRLLPNPKHDIWSLGVTVLELVRGLPEYLKKTPYIRALKSLIRKQIRQPANSRIDIHTFIDKLDKLLEKTGLAENIQRRIDEHIYASTDLKTSKLVLKLSQYYETITQELKQEDSIVKSIRSSFFPDHDKQRKKQIAGELQRVLTKQGQNLQEKRKEITRLIQKNIGLFSNGRLREIALEVSPEYRESLQLLSDKSGL